MRCCQKCEDDVKHEIDPKVGPTPELERRVYQCADQCANTTIQALPAMLKRMADLVAKAKASNV
jgi:hypothetical protein